MPVKVQMTAEKPTATLSGLDYRNLVPVIRAIFIAVRDEIEFDQASFVFLDAEGNPRRESAFQAGSPRLENSQLPVSANVLRVLRSGVPLINNDLQPNDGRSQTLVDVGIRCTMVVPVCVDEAVLGTLNLGAERSDAYDESDLHKAMAILERFNGVLGEARRYSINARITDQESAVEHTRPRVPAQVPPFVLRADRVLSQISDAVLIDDVDGRVLFANRAFRILFGLEDESLEDIVLEDYVAPEWREILRKRHNDRIRGIEVANEFEYIGLRRDGTRLALEVTVVPVIEDGVMLGTQSMIRDVTERKKLEQKKVHAQRMEALGQLAGGIAHDFNNLLTAMVACPVLIRHKLEDEEDFEEELEILESAVERAVVLTRQLLAFSRKRVVSAGHVDIADSMASLQPMLRRLIEENIDLVLETAQRKCVAAIHPNQLEQIVVNLVINARDAGATEIRLGAESLHVSDEEARDLGFGPGKFAIATVVDNGAGMSPEVVARIFDPFFTTKTVGRGTGLGLAMVHGIVEASGGAIRVESQPGQGTTFKIRFQAGSTPLQKKALTLSFGELTRAATVLLVEDDEVSRRTIAALLSSGGMSVVEATDGDRAMAIVEDPHFGIDLVLTDLVMPRASGIEVAAHLAAHRPRVPVILMSGHAKGVLADLIPSLRLPFLEKPLRRASLFRLIQEVLDRADSTQTTNKA